jgi:hypothetical protein
MLLALFFGLVPQAPGERIRALGYLVLTRARMSKDPQAPGGHIRDLGLGALARMRKTFWR